MSQDAQSKAHSHKPFYFVALSSAVQRKGDKLREHLDSLSSAVALFQHGGSALDHIAEED